MSQDFCAACSMPITNPEELGATVGENKFCIHCVNADGSVKSCSEIFEGGVNFFLTSFPEYDRTQAERLTRKNMCNLSYWQDKDCDCLKGEQATDEEFQELMSKF